MAASNISESFQIPLAAAERYETAFVPNFFAQWAPTLCQAGGVAPGGRVLDVACGTGIVARTAAELTGSGTGIVRHRPQRCDALRRPQIRADIEWRQADAASLPFADGSFDAVLSQMALMFLPDRPAAIGEMARVVSDSAEPWPSSFPVHSTGSLPSSPSSSSPPVSSDRTRFRCSPPISCAASSTSSPPCSSRLVSP